MTIPTKNRACLLCTLGPMLCRIRWQRGHVSQASGCTTHPLMGLQRGTYSALVMAHISRSSTVDSESRNVDEGVSRLRTVACANPLDNAVFWDFRLQHLSLAIRRRIDSHTGQPTPSNRDGAHDASSLVSG